MTTQTEIVKGPIKAQGQIEMEPEEQHPSNRKKKRVRRKKPDPSVKAAEPENKLAPLGIDKKTQQLVVEDGDQLMRQINLLWQGKAFPATMDTPAKCVAAWNLAASFGNVSPQRAMSRMMYIGGQLSIWGELPKALAEATKELKKFELFVIDADYKKICMENKNLISDPFAAICRIMRNDRSLNEYHFTMQDASVAGLLTKKGDIWKKFTKVMLMWRAQGQALKYEFGDALMGAEIAETRFDEYPGLKDVTPHVNTASGLMADYVEEDK